jgi:hypothetical protein
MGFEITGLQCLFLPFYHWDIYLGQLEGFWIFSHSGALSMDQLHGTGLLGSFVDLAGKTPRICLLECLGPKTLHLSHEFLSYLVE